ncbi:MAG TPA: hypothetical protein VFB15_07415 [Candidatus Binataceae bacterium]|jgi:hypothetical protein|nr:hypothetical protein [Candidatus Binataceae bacterium]
MDKLDRDESTETGATNEEPGGHYEHFYRGLIVRLDRARARGVIRSNSGREIPFQFPFVTVIGAPLGGRAPGLDRLRQGDEVGFDVGWTSRGLRVTAIKPSA